MHTTHRNKSKKNCLEIDPNGDRTHDRLAQLNLGALTHLSTEFQLVEERVLQILEVSKKSINFGWFSRPRMAQNGRKTGPGLCFRTRSISWSKWCSDFCWFFLVLPFQTSQGNEFETKFDISGDLKTNFMFVQWICGHKLVLQWWVRLKKRTFFRNWYRFFRHFDNLLVECASVYFNAIK